MIKLPRPLEQMKMEARRDDWHMSYVGSDIRVLILLIEQLRAQLALPYDAKPNPAGAVFGVLAWLSTRPEELKIGASNDCAILAELADKFCKANHFDDPNDMTLVIHPNA